MSWREHRKLRTMRGPAKEANVFNMAGKLTKYLRRGVAGMSRFRKAQHGATAVEFALIAPAFLATLIAVFQTCIFMFAQMSLQNAAVQAGRYFMTGQAQNGGWSSSTVVSKVCPSALFTCSKMVLVVQNAASFSAASTAAPALYSNGNAITSFAYNPGTPGEVMVVQLVYPWSVVSGPLGFALSNLPNGAAEMMGVSAFRVEPY
jgi:Flp pilus assembly protein TadG